MVYDHSDARRAIQLHGIYSVCRGRCTVDTVTADSGSRITFDVGTAESAQPRLNSTLRNPSGPVVPSASERVPPAR